MIIFIIGFIKYKAKSNNIIMLVLLVTKRTKAPNTQQVFIAIKLSVVLLCETLVTPWIELQVQLSMIMSATKKSLRMPLE